MALDKITLDELVAVNEEIAALVRAGVPLERGLAELAAELPARSGRLAARLAERTERGATLLEAIDAEGDRLPPVYRAVVAAGLRSGRLDAAVEGLVDTGRRMADLRRVTGLALLYPLVIVIAAWGLMGLALLVVLPQVGRIADRNPTISSPVPDGWTVLLVAVLVALGLVTIGLVYRWRRAGWAGTLTKGGGSTRRLGRTTSVRRVRMLSQAAAFADFLALLIEHGVPLPESLDLAVNAAGARYLKPPVEQLARAIENGRTVSEEREAVDRLPALIRLAVLSHRDGAAMVGGLRAAADTYRHRADQDADWLTLRIPVILTLLLGGGTVAAYAALVLVPYISGLRSMANWV